MHLGWCPLFNEKLKLWLPQDILFNLDKSSSHLKTHSQHANFILSQTEQDAISLKRLKHLNRMLVSFSMYCNFYISYKPSCIWWNKPLNPDPDTHQTWFTSFLLVTWPHLWMFPKIFSLTNSLTFTVSLTVEYISD